MKSVKTIIVDGVEYQSVPDITPSKYQIITTTTDKIFTGMVFEERDEIVLLDALTMTDYGLTVWCDGQIRLPKHVIAEREMITERGYKAIGRLAELDNITEAIDVFLELMGRN